MALNVNIEEKRFDTKLIFENFSYQFKENGIYALSAESGKGKTTLLRLIAGLDKDFKGVIEGGGFENVSMHFQEYRLFPNLTALENVVFASNALENVAKSLLSRFEFTENDMQLYPRELSGGMKQRVSLCRAILKESPVLLLDEPTKELDSELKERLYEVIKKESENRLIILSSHDKFDFESLSAKVIYF